MPSKSSSPQWQNSFNNNDRNMSWRGNSFDHRSSAFPLRVDTIRTLVYSRQTSRFPSRPPSLKLLLAWKPTPWLNPHSIADSFRACTFSPVVIAGYEPSCTCLRDYPDSTVAHPKCPHTESGAPPQAPFLAPLRSSLRDLRADSLRIGLRLSAHRLASRCGQ